MYFNEDLILDVRLNTLNPFIDNFVIVESNFTHSGEKKEFNFNINNYQKFKDTDIKTFNIGEVLNLKFLI